MSDDANHVQPEADHKVRRSLALPPERTSDLNAIKKGTGAKTDTAAINQAVEFRARLATRNIEEVERALRFWDVVQHEIGVDDRLLILNKNLADTLSRTQRAGAKMLVPV